MFETWLLVLIVLIGLICPILGMIHLLFFEEMKRYSKKKRTKKKFLLALLIMFIPFGWLIYFLIKNRV